MTYFLLFIIIILLIIIGYLTRQITIYKNQHDYYISVDEENERLKSQHTLTENK